MAMAKEAETTIYVGGIPKAATEGTLAQHFNNYGGVLRCQISRDSITNTSRGYGFVTFASASTLDKVFQCQHIILEKQVEVGRAIQKSRRYIKRRNWNNDAYNNTINNDTQLNTKKIFVGGLPAEITEKDLENYFKKYGTVTNAVIIRNCWTKKARGFGFVSFESEKAAEDALLNDFQELNGKTVQVKRAVPEHSEKAAYYDNGGHEGLVVPYSHPHYGYIKAIMSSPYAGDTYEVYQNEPRSSHSVFGNENVAAGYLPSVNLLHGGSNMPQWSNDAGNSYGVSRGPWLWNESTMHQYPHADELLMHQNPYAGGDVHYC